MNVDVVVKIGSILFQAIELGVTYAPAIITDLRRVWNLATSGSVLTPEQLADADAAVAAAHQELQTAVAKAALADAGDQPAS